jgi:hypothetical protein
MAFMGFLVFHQFARNVHDHRLDVAGKCDRRFIPARDRFLVSFLPGWIGSAAFLTALTPIRVQRVGVERIWESALSWQCA